MAVFDMPKGERSFTMLSTGVGALVVPLPEAFRVGPMVASLVLAYLGATWSMTLTSGDLRALARWTPDDADRLATSRLYHVASLGVAALMATTIFAEATVPLGADGIFLHGPFAPVSDAVVLGGLAAQALYEVTS